MSNRRAATLWLALLAASALPGTTVGATPSPEATPAPGPAVVVSHGPRTERRIALTFDDGHGTPDCSALVDVLVATQTPATFFPSARWAADSPDLWHRIAALGFPVGNHTAHHVNLSGLALGAQLAEITDDRAAMEAAMGASMAPLFRPPYGSYDATTVRAAAAAGERYLVLWDTTLADSSKRPNGKPYPLDAYIRSAEKGTNGSIILGHCGDPIDPQVIGQVVADYRARGFTLVTVPQLLGMPGARPMAFASPTPSAPGTASPTAPGSAAPSQGGTTSGPTDAVSTAPTPAPASAAAPPADPAAVAAVAGLAAVILLAAVVAVRAAARGRRTPPG